jgi:hypothetical protein
MESRRRAVRHPAGWRGAVLIEDELGIVEWRECVVLDTSMLGIGITFHDHRTTELVGLSVSVEVPAEAKSISVRLEGVVKNALGLRFGIVRAGIEFSNMTPAESAIAAVLGALTEVEARAIVETSAPAERPCTGSPSPSPRRDSNRPARSG